MENLINEFRDFFNSYSRKLKKVDCLDKSFEYLDQYRLMPGQALYVVDWKWMQISYQRGIDRMLGYSKEEFNHDLLSSYCHPDDFERYLHLLKISNRWARKIKPEPFSVETSINYRIRKKDNSYIKVLRQSTVYENCIDRSIKSAFTLLTDITHIQSDVSVNLSIIDMDSGYVMLEKKDGLMPKLPAFTNREIEILKLLKEGYSSNSIAEYLYISKNTVDTHRRKMLSKTKLKNTMELVNAASEFGVI